MNINKIHEFRIHLFETNQVVVYEKVHQQILYP